MGKVTETSSLVNSFDTNTGDTASNLGNAMDEMMRHQPSLRSETTKAIIKVGYTSIYHSTERHAKIIFRIIFKIHVALHWKREHGRGMGSPDTS